MAALLSVTIPLTPPSENSLYQIIYSQRRVQLKPSVRLFKTRFKAFIPPTSIPLNTLLELSLSFSLPLYYLNGKLKKVDLSNWLKPTQDALCERLGIDDSRIWILHLRKHHSEKPSIQVYLYLLSESA